MVYVPEYNEGNCAYILNSDVIRVYNSIPQHNTTISYKDYYIKSSYIYNEGNTTFSNYSTLPVCISDERITTSHEYRNDFPQILFIFLVFAFCCLWIPWRIYCRIFRRYL